MRRRLHERAGHIQLANGKTERDVPALGRHDRIPHPVLRAQTVGEERAGDDGNDSCDSGDAFHEFTVRSVRIRSKDRSNYSVPTLVDRGALRPARPLELTSDSY